LRIFRYNKAVNQIKMVQVLRLSRSMLARERQAGRWQDRFHPCSLCALQLKLIPLTEDAGSAGKTEPSWSTVKGGDAWQTRFPVIFVYLERDTLTTSERRRHSYDHE
jgi:hypothetical protein